MAMVQCGDVEGGINCREEVAERGEPVGGKEEEGEGCVLEKGGGEPGSGLPPFKDDGEKYALGCVCVEVVKEEGTLKDSLFGVESTETKAGIIWGAKKNGLSRVLVEAKASGKSWGNHFVELL